MKQKILSFMNSKVVKIASVAGAIAPVAMTGIGYCAEGDPATPVVAGVVTAATLQGVLNELVALLPVVMPVMVSFIGIRKAISFVFGMLRAA